MTVDHKTTGIYMERHGEAWAALAKVSAAWLCTLVSHAISSITLSGLALAVTTVYSGLQTYVLVRDKIMRKSS